MYLNFECSASFVNCFRCTPILVLRIYKSHLFDFIQTFVPDSWVYLGTFISAIITLKTTANFRLEFKWSYPNTKCLCILSFSNLLISKKFLWSTFFLVNAQNCVGQQSCKCFLSTKMCPQMFSWLWIHKQID